MTAALLPVAVKGALVLAAAFLALRLLRDAPAALRHGVWTAAFAALLALPALDAFGPSWALPILPGSLRTTETVETFVVADPFVGPLPQGALVLGPDELPPPGEPILRPEPFARALPGQTVVVVPSPPHPAAVPGGPWVPAGRGPFGAWIAGLWALGAAAVLLRWTAAYISAAAVVRAAVPVTDDGWLELAERARRLVGVRGDVRLVRSQALTVPVAWGLGAPAVVLPANADAWAEGRREAVLLHEMAHLRRADARTQIVAQLAVALHWPNPLAWLAYRRFLTEREHACDDAVLSGGAAPSDYAGHLVEIARRARRREPLALSVVSPMARRSDLEGRVLSVLDAGRRRVAAGRSTLVRTVALGLLVAVPLGTVHAVAGPTEPAPVVPIPSPTAAAPSTPAPSVPPTPPATAPAPEAVEADLADALLDTIPRAETLLGPALTAVLADLDRLRADGRGLDEDTWDEIENDVREAFSDAHLDYDGAVASALAEARTESTGDAGWHAALREALAEAETERQTAVAEMAEAVAARTAAWGRGGDARRDADRRARAAQAAYRIAEQTQQGRERTLRDANRDRQRAIADGQRARDIALRDAERVRREAQRQADETRRASRRAVAVTAGVGVAAWTTQLDALDHAADGIGQAIAEVEARGTAQPGVAAGLRGGLAGLEGALAGVAATARSWAQSDAERQIAQSRIDATRRRIRDVKQRLGACGDACH